MPVRVHLQMWAGKREKLILHDHLGNTLTQTFLLRPHMSFDNVPIPGFQLMEPSEAWIATSRRACSMTLRCATLKSPSARSRFLN